MDICLEKKLAIKTMCYSSLILYLVFTDSEDAGNREVLFPCGNLCRDVLCDTLEAHSQCHTIFVQKLQINFKNLISSPKKTLLQNNYYLCIFFISDFHITEVKVYETVAKEDVSNELYVITQSKVKYFIRKVCVVVRVIFLYILHVKCPPLHCH